MTEEWERLGLWDAYKEDIADRSAHHPIVARPSPLGYENYYDRYVGRKSVEYIKKYSDKKPMC